MSKRILALALAFCMVFSLLPLGAQAKSLRDEVLQLDKNIPKADSVQSNPEIDLILDGLTGPQLREPGDTTYQEIEPNDNFENVYLLENDYTIHGTLPDDDVDCFAFELEEDSKVSIVAVCTTEALVMALADLGTKEWLYESVYLEQDEETGMHAMGLGVELAAGTYGLALVENDGLEAEYEFYIQIKALDHTHSYTTEVTEPTCTEAGYTTYTCSCGDTYTSDEVPALGHHEVADAAVPATCTEKGLTEGSHCDRCGIAIQAQEEVPALGHNEVMDTEQIDPTCTEPGMTASSHCERCGVAIKVQQEISALGHQAVIDAGQPATCTEPGKTDGSHCGRCGVVLETPEEIPALGHNEVTDAAVAPTCTEAGLTEGSHCDRCGLVIIAQEEVAALGHNEVADEEIAPTCTEPGLTGGTHCDRCGIVMQEAEVAPALGHEEVTDEAVSPTCVEPGKTEGSHCGRCGIVIVAQEEILPEGHDYEDGVCVNCGQAVPGEAWYCGEDLVALFDEETGTLTISGTGRMYDYSASNPVPWKDQISEITKAVVEPGVASIGAYAFADCENLETVTIPYGLENIGDNAFAGCAELTGVVLPAALTGLGSGAFSGCESLTAITIPGGVDTISDSAFEDCSDLEEVILQEGLVRIESAAFKNCSALQAIEFPIGLKYIYDEAFSGCKSLKEITFQGDAPNTISEDAFTGVVANAYYYCRNTTWTEKKMQNYGGKLTWSSFNKEEDASGKCGANLTWNYEAATDTLTITGTGAMYDYADTAETPWSQLQLVVVKVIVEDGASTIGKWAFAQLPELEEVQLPASVSYISDCAFAMCQNLTTINIPAKVTYIGEMCFQQCASLDNVVLPETLTSLEMYVFADCVSLTSITIPGSLASIEEYALAGCTALKEVIIEEGVPVIGDGMFVTCPALETITIPASVKEIGFEAFFESGLKEITFMGDAPVFEDGCFADCVATAYYPANNKTWNDQVMKDYGGSITWTVYGVVLPYDRVYGESRCETAYETANMLKEVLGVEKFSSIIIANGDNFADALAGSYLAARKSAPILLYRSAFEDENLAYITENLASGGTVYILGGTLAVPQSMEDALKGFKVKRLYGENRFETNLKILEEAGVTGQEILICTGWEFADSLSASATGLPILLVDSRYEKLTDGQTAFLKAHADNTYTIIGGSVAVSTKVEEMIEGTIERQVGRIYGDSREQTSAKVAETYFTDPDCVILAYSRNFPDGLCGGPLAYAMNAPLLLVNTRNEAAAAAYVKENGIEKGVVLGGTGVVSDESGKIVFGME